MMGQRSSWRPVSGRARGLSLIELMIAMALGLFLTSAIFELFLMSGRIQATQSGLARLQENGRIAISSLTADLQQAGRLPCGSQIRPQVYVDTLSLHIAGKPPSANPVPGAESGTPYPLDQGIFIEGYACTAARCAPVVSSALGAPKAGTAVGDRVPGTDVIAVRYLQGSGWPAVAIGAGPQCDAGDNLAAIRVSGLPGSGFDPGHLAVLASCTQAQIFAVDAELKPLTGNFGQPKCDRSNTLRLFDLDTQLQTSVYYLQLVEDASQPARRISTLMRRTNGIVNEVVQGIERFDIRFYVHDASGGAHWLSADRVDQGIAQDGSSLLCDAATERHCSWSDIDAVDLDLLVNSVDDLPFEGTEAAMQYRYSPDGDQLQAPKETLPTTGLPAGHMLRREFHTVVALRSIKS